LRPASTICRTHACMFGCTWTAYAAVTPCCVAPSTFRGANKWKVRRVTSILTVLRARWVLHDKRMVVFRRTTVSQPSVKIYDSQLLLRYNVLYPRNAILVCIGLVHSDKNFLQSLVIVLVQKIDAPSATLTRPSTASNLRKISQENPFSAFEVIHTQAWLSSKSVKTAFEVGPSSVPLICCTSSLCTYLPYGGARDHELSLQHQAFVVAFLRST